MAQTETQQAPYSNKAEAIAFEIEQPMTRLQRLVVENLQLSQQLDIERDHVNKCRAWAQELETGLNAMLQAVRVLKEELAGQRPE